MLWGGLHGVYLVVHRLAFGGRVSDEPIHLRSLPAIVFTFFWVHLAWVFFRADTITGAFDILGRVATLQSGLVARADVALVLGLGAVSLMLDLMDRRTGEQIQVLRRAPALTGAAVAAAVAAIVVFSGGTPEPFIYFQF